MTPTKKIFLAAGLLALAGGLFSCRSYDHKHFKEEKKKKIAVAYHALLSGFQWNEYRSGNDRLLDETGALLGLGSTVSLGLSELAMPRFTAEFFGGTVDYDGETIGPPVTPVDSETDYLGFKIE
ncbi:MAG: hypothetical protein ACYTHM_20175, partial [Planctomycetota bacterium]